VEHSTGTVLKVGQGSLDCLNLDPGFYRARCRTPENEVEEQTIGLSAGASESVQLDAPDVPYTRLVRNAIKVANGRIHSDRTIEFAGVGSVAAAHISTIVTLAGSVANGPTTFNAPGLRRLGAWAFRDKVPQDMSGVYLLFAADVATNKDTLDYISKVEVRLWPQSGTRPGTFDRLAPFSRAAGLAQLVQGAYPGSYWLELTLPERPAVAFALNILDGRLTMLVVSRELAGQIHVFQYLPSLAPSGFLRPDQMRQLELFQRFYLSGQLEHAAQIASQILKDGWGDPISECLAGYLLLRRGDNASLGVFDQFMMTRPYHNKMSDSYVLHAEYEARQGDDAQAESIYRTAINQGLPIIVDGLRRLADGVQRYHIQNPSADWITNVYRNRVGSWLWSAVS